MYFLECFEKSKELPVLSKCQTKSVIILDQHSQTPNVGSQLRTLSSFFFFKDKNQNPFGFVLVNEQK